MAKNSFNEPALTASFADIVKSVTKVVHDQKHQHAVDLRLHFKSVRMSKTGIPVFSKKTKESVMELEIATRVVYDPNVQQEEE